MHLPAFRLVVPIAAAALLAAGCGSGNRAPLPPAQVSLVAPSSPLMEENPVEAQFTVSLSPIVATETRVTVSLGGTATPDVDYAFPTLSLAIPPGTATASLPVRAYRDFDAEGDETILVTLDRVEGNAQPGATTQAEATLVDGPSDADFKNAGNPVFRPGIEAVTVPTRITATGFSLEVIFAGRAMQPSPPLTFAVELSRSLAFEAVQVIAQGEIPPLIVRDFLDFRVLPIDISSLAPGDYFLRLRVIVPEGEDVSVILAPPSHGFSVGADGRVVTTCRPPERPAPAAAGDPLFAGSWHLQNTGQRGFAQNGGIAGNDLGMTGVLANGPTGRGVNVVVHDTGTQICHPDLAANMAGSESWNFNAGINFGAGTTDPYYPWNLGDHGTSVAGIIGAVANNGIGSRGVASEVNLRTYSFPTFSAVEGIEDIQASSLGASEDSPNSSTGHIFNMSYSGDEANSNAPEDFVNLMRFGTGELRGGRGAIYVKAAGNGFDKCSGAHPLSAVVGCAASTDDPANNLPYLLNVGAFRANGLRADYSSVGPNLWVVAPAGLDTPEAPAIVTTDQTGLNAGYTARFSEQASVDDGGLNPFGDYTTLFSGTSAAAPATAGAIAVLLEAVPGLTWRDVKHVLANTAVQLEPDLEPFRVYYNGKPYLARLPWVTTAAGYHFHNHYGFGAVALDDALQFARRHQPGSLGPFVESAWYEQVVAEGQMAQIPDRDGGGVERVLAITDIPPGASIEAVTLAVNIVHASPLDLGIHLISPSGTESIANPVVNTRLRFHENINSWNLLNNAFYGEDPNGEWTLRVVDVLEGDVGALRGWKLKIHYGAHPQGESV